MSSERNIRPLRIAILAIAVGVLASGFFSPSNAQEEQRPERSAASDRNRQGAKVPPGDADKGRQVFEDNCATCHGVDASGGEGPNIQQAPATLGDSEVRNIIRRGVPGTEMPGFFDISDADAANIVTYLRKLGRIPGSGTVSGDPRKGESIYDASGCSACHMIAGQGGDLGPELTRIGSMRGPSNLRARLLDPAANLPKEGGVGDRGDWTLHVLFRAVTKNGQVLEGMRVGENSFSIVLKDASGNFHALWKPDLRSLEKEPGKSFMPSFKGSLSATDLDDLVAYLVSLKGAQ
jgi:cytochrome c oxidase cbb3-type subunit III